MMRASKRKNKKNTLSELMPVVVVAVIGYVLLSGGFGLFAIMGLDSTSRLIDVPTGEYFEGKNSFIDVDMNKISDSQLKIDVGSYVPIVKEKYGYSWLPCQHDNACVHMERAGNGVLMKVFVVDIDNSTYLETVVEDYGKFNTSKPFGFFAWNNGNEYVKIAESMGDVVGYEPCSSGSRDCFKYPVSETSKIIELPAGHYLVEVRGVAVRDISPEMLDFTDDYWDRNPKERLNNIKDKILRDECSEPDWKAGISEGFVSFMYSNDYGERCFGTTNPNLGISTYDYGRNELLLFDSMEFTVEEVAVEPPLIHLPEPPEEPPEVIDEQVPGLFDGFFAGVNTWLNGIWRMFIGIFYV